MYLNIFISSTYYYIILTIINKIPVVIKNNRPNIFEILCEKSETNDKYKIKYKPVYFWENIL